MLAPRDFFDLEGFSHAALFEGCDLVWQGLGERLKRYIAAVLRPGIEGTVMEGAIVERDKVYVGPGAVIEPGAYVKGPTIIEAGAVVRHGAYIRGEVILGERAILGHASEAKGSLFLPDAKAPHFNYVGDALLGRHVNLGAGTKLSNLKVLNEPIKLMIGDDLYDTGLRKLGGVLGDRVQTGCNAVLNPGVLLAPDCVVYANLAVRKGYYPPRRILKLRQEIGIEVLEKR